MAKVTVKGRAYFITATYGKLKRLKDSDGIDLLTPSKGGFPDFIQDHEACFTTICALAHTVEDQAKPLTRVDAERLADDAEGSDVAALIRGVAEALKDFFRGRGDVELEAQVDLYLDTFMAARTQLAAKIREADLASRITEQVDRLDLMAEFDRATNLTPGR